MTALAATASLPSPLPARRWDYSPDSIREFCEHDGKAERREQIATFAALEWNYDKDAANWARVESGLSEEEFDRMLQSLARRNVDIWGAQADGGAARLARAPAR